MEMKEYCNKCNQLANEKKWDDLSDFQYKYMTKVLSDYGKVVQNTTDPLDKDARIVIYDIFHYAIYRSETGNSIQDLDRDAEELADRVTDLLNEDLGDYLLDYMVYEENGEWTVDCMFAGCFVPEWDGWKED